MALITALMQLKCLNTPVISTTDAAACLKVNRQHASKILSRLADSGIICWIAQGKWLFSEIKDLFIVSEFLTTPFPSYISLQSALFYHGMISQIPEVVYVVSLARTKKYITPIGVISIHHLQPAFFFGYENVTEMIKMALPEKALLDFFYLSSTKTHLFSSLPELELPKTFNTQLAFAMIEHIPNSRLKTLLTNKLTRLLS